MDRLFPGPACVSGSEWLRAGGLDADLPDGLDADLPGSPAWKGHQLVWAR